MMLTALLWSRSMQLPHGHPFSAYPRTAPGTRAGSGRVTRARVPELCNPSATLVILSCYPSGSMGRPGSAGYGRLCGSLMRFYRGTRHAIALRKCPSF